MKRGRNYPFILMSFRSLMIHKKRKMKSSKNYCNMLIDIIKRNKIISMLTCLVSHQPWELVKLSCGYPSELFSFTLIIIIIIIVIIINDNNYEVILMLVRIEKGKRIIRK